MKRVLSLLMTAMILSLVCIPSALAADTSSVCYPTSVTRSEDGTEIRKVYDLGPEEDPAGISRSDFQQDGVRYTLVDLLKQELPENESRQHVETVTLESKNKDMASVLELLPQQREFVTDDGLSGVLTLQLDTVQVDVSGYGSSTRAVNVTRSYPNLAGQDTSYIPKTIQDGGRTLTLQDISWQTDNTAIVISPLIFIWKRRRTRRGPPVAADPSGTAPWSWGRRPGGRLSGISGPEGRKKRRVPRESGASVQRG